MICKEEQKNTTLKTFSKKIWKLSINERPIIDKVENIVAKGGIGHHEQFLLLPQYFYKLFAVKSSENILYGCKSLDKRAMMALESLT